MYMMWGTKLYLNLNSNKLYLDRGAFYKAFLAEVLCDTIYKKSDYQNKYLYEILFSHSFSLIKTKGHLMFYRL